MITRTFSKAYGLAGYRSGFIHAGTNLIDDIRGICQSLLVSPSPIASLVCDETPPELLGSTPTNMATDISAAHWLNLHAACLKDQNKKITREASMAKYFASEKLNKIAYNALQVFGGYGYIKDYKIEKLFRDARVTTIYEGTSEVQQIVIAREIFKGN